MGKKKIILALAVALPVILIVAVVAIATRGFSQPLMLSISLGPTAEAAAASSGEEAAASPAVAPVVPTPDFGSGILVDLGSKVVNLADPGGYRYLKVGVVLELTPTNPAYYAMKAAERVKEDARLSTLVTERRALVDDMLINCVSDKTFGDIFTMAGKDRLKDELRTAITQRLGGQVMVSRVYFTDFVVN